ncbi:MAG: hypothetical protein U0R24_00845 [Solirubrobacterales bacterium]
MDEVLQLAERLDQARISYDVTISRTDRVMFSIAVPGEHWEVEFGAGGVVEVEVFRSNGEISDESALQRLFAEFSD